MTQSDTLPVREPDADEGPGCLPGILAAGALILILLFVICGVSTWWLFQQRTELAVRSLRGSVIPELQQSGLAPDEKHEVIAQLRQVIEQAEAGQLEDWQASGIMERLNRTPLLQWGDLAALQALIEQSDAFTDAEREQAVRQFSRLRRAAQLRRAGSVEMHNVLEPVLTGNAPEERPRLNRDAPADAMGEAVERAKRIADREDIPDQTFDVSLAEIVREDVQQGLTTGGL